MKISIITVSYNSSKTIEDTFKSVLNQTYKNIEYLVIDGHSKDGTVNIIKKYEERFKNENIELKWISEKDKGLYDAMNKGIEMSTGDIIGIVNSDDFYNGEEVLQEVVKKFLESDYMGVYGDLVYVEQTNTDIVKRYWKSKKYKIDNFLFGWMPPHPTVFLKKEVYEKYGNFRLDMGTSADYEILIRFFYKHKLKMGYIPKILVRMREGGVSNIDVKARIKANKTDKKAWIVNDIIPYFFTIYLKPFRKIKQFFLKCKLTGGNRNEIQENRNFYK